MGGDALLGHVLREAAFDLEVVEALAELGGEELLDTLAEHNDDARRVDGVVGTEERGEASVFGQEILADFGEIVLREHRRILKLVVASLDVAWVFGAPHRGVVAHEPLR